MWPGWRNHGRAEALELTTTDATLELTARVPFQHATFGYAAFGAQQHDLSDLRRTNTAGAAQRKAA